MKFISFDTETQGNVMEFCCDGAKKMYNEHDIVYVNNLGKFYLSLQPRKENKDIQYLEEMFFCMKCGKHVQ